jgi:hypothetical protein
MWDISTLSKMERLRFENIIDMGLAYSTMLRVFVEGSKEELANRLIGMTVEKIFNAGSEDEFDKAHADFCNWGICTIRQAKGGALASYGQIAKTLDVTLKVAVYYSHLPSCDQSKKLCEWLNSAVDANMMYELRKKHPDAIKPWPTTVKEVDKNAYLKMQQLVRQEIVAEYDDAITPRSMMTINGEKRINS